MAEKMPFRTEHLRLETGERFVLTVDADGVPVWWPNLYCQIAIREQGIEYKNPHPEQRYDEKVDEQSRKKRDNKMPSEELIDAALAR